MSAHEWGEPAGEENQQLVLRERGLGRGARTPSWAALAAGGGGACGCGLTGDPDARTQNRWQPRGGAVVHCRAEHSRTPNRRRSEMGAAWCDGVRLRGGPEAEPLASRKGRSQVQCQLRRAWPRPREVPALDRKGDSRFARGLVQMGFRGGVGPAGAFSRQHEGAMARSAV